jgi:hypothetical protein
MPRAKVCIITFGILVLIAGLGLLRFASLRRRAPDGGLARQQLSVGFLPVT